jgi:putative membrane protein
VPAFVAFLHYVAAFTPAGALAIELVLLRDELTLRSARRLLIVDAVLGASAGVVLVAGLLRVFYFEKGAAYYFHSLPFIAKFSLFVAIAVLSIYPTMTFLSWRGAVKQGQAPLIEADKMRRIRSLIHFELVLLAVVILCAALMAKGIGVRA